MGTVERLLAKEDDALVSRPRLLWDPRGIFDFRVAATIVKIAKSHDLRVARAELAVRRGATSVEDCGDRPVHAFHCPSEIRVRELVEVSLAHNKKAEAKHENNNCNNKTNNDR